MTDLFPDAQDPDLPGAPRQSGFEPTMAAALARIDAVQPNIYARTRNHLDGAVTRLSPYLTHGFVQVPQVIERPMVDGQIISDHNPILVDLELAH